MYYPQVGDGAFVAPNASVIGNVRVENDASIWYGTIVRGDAAKISIGMKSSLGDNCILNTSTGSDSGSPLHVGERVTVGNGSVLTGCTLENECSVEMGSVISPGAVIGSRSVVGAGSVVLEGVKIPSGQMWSGSPARYIRDLTDAEKESIVASVEKWSALAQRHLAQHKRTPAELTQDELRASFEVLSHAHQHVYKY